MERKCDRRMRVESPLREWPRRGRFGGPPVEVEFGAHPLQRADVHRPPLRGASPAPSPILVFLHGGAWRAGSRKRHRFVGGALARRGFLTMIPDYRKHPTCGYAGSLADAAAAVGWIVKHGPGLNADPGRVILAGHSAGAFMAAALALQDGPLGAHGVNRDRVRGVVGVSGLYADPRRYSFLKPVFEEAGEDVSPLRLAAKGARPETPFLLIHGRKDRVVAFDECSRFASAIAGAGGRAVVRALPKAGHVGPLLAMGAVFRRLAPCLDDITLFSAGLGGAHSS